MNVLLVGLGRWGEKHLRVLRELGVQLWVADASAARLEWAVKQGIDAARVVADWRDALPQVEAVDVVTPSGSHRSIAGACLEAGRQCFVEKPLASTAAEGRELERLARTTGRVLQVGHVFRFHPVTDALREALRGGRIGRVRYATGRFAGFKRPRTDVGVTHTDALHYFDLFAHLLGHEPRWVTAFQRDFLGRGLDDLGLAVVGFGETPAMVEANYFLPGTWRECVIVGTLGALVADFASSTVTLHLGEHVRRGDAWEVADQGKEMLSVDGGEPLLRELAAFLAAAEGRAGNPVPASDGVRALEIVEAAALSARLGRTVALDELR